MSKFEGFRAMAHLLEQLGDEQFAALIDSANTGEVKKLCNKLLEDAPLTKELTNIGPENRNYDILGFLRDDEKYVVGHTMVERAVEMEANLGEDDGQYLLRYQLDIPESLRRKVRFVFTDWHHPTGGVYYVFWSEHHREWKKFMSPLYNDWLGRNRFLRPK